ncbi:MAG: hypothetical protein ACRDJ9_21080, partial [Dehalococcoidia bacterium]
MDLLRDPIGTLRQEYLGDTGLRTAADAQRTANRLFPHLGAFLAALGARASYLVGPHPQIGPELGPVADRVAPGVLAISFPGFRGANGDEVRLGGVLALSAVDRGDLGVVILPFGEISSSRQAAEWQVDVALTGSVGAFAVGPHGLTLIAPADVASVSGEITARSLPGPAGAVAEEEDTGIEPAAASTEPAPAFVIGGPGGTHFEVGEVRVNLNWALDAAEQDFGFLASINRATLVVSAGDGDGFLQK